MRIPLPALAFATLILLTIVSGFFKWVQLPQTPIGYWAAEELAYQKLKQNKNPDDSAKENLIWLACETNRADEAHTMMAALQDSRSEHAMDAYDPAYSNGFSKLATIELCARRIGSALLVYFEQLEYDKEFLPADDKRIGRDYNNLGMTYFMHGQTSEKAADREKYWKEATAMWDKAAATKMVDDPLMHLSLVQNQLLLAEGRDDLPAIGRLQRTTGELRSQLNVKVPVVQF